MGDNGNVSTTGVAKVEDDKFPLTDKDRYVLSLTDEEFKYQDWEQLRGILATNSLEELKRRPSDLRRYIAWSAETKAQYGSMTNYLLQHRLPWGSPPFKYLSPIPFENTADYKILLNDWPYGLTKDITHIVVWSKTPIATDEKTGDVTVESRKIIEEFVQKIFTARLGGDKERVMWFKNWVALQSVRSLEHIHVLVKDVSQKDLEFWTGKGV